MPVCPSCRVEVDPDSELCLDCGASLDPAQLKAQMAPPPVAPAPATPIAPKPRPRVEEPEAVRCKGCGSPSKAARCPGCGAVLRRED